ncbi:hypothetical protein CCACVL1_04121 [Corchorus capsularis]|uniref:Uncharacterized protein n=1 Tax=Corchorus capsularis TaxID=210143 RepID=A0A1R3JVH6_COCAP|nr:hypothetical protein CCACVL1_04121 [Corchorus capsularis]
MAGIRTEVKKETDLHILAFIGGSGTVACGVDGGSFVRRRLGFKLF